MSKNGIEVKIMKFNGIFLSFNDDILLLCFPNFENYQNFHRLKIIFRFTSSSASVKYVFIHVWLGELPFFHEFRSFVNKIFVFQHEIIRFRAFSPKNLFQMFTWMYPAVIMCYLLIMISD